MSAALYRWIAVASLQYVLLTPALAIDTSFGDEPATPAAASQPVPSNTPTNNVSQDLATQTSTSQTAAPQNVPLQNSLSQNNNPELANSALANPATAQTTNAGAPTPDNGDINFNTDDPLTFQTLQRITLKNLNVDASAEQPTAIKDPFEPINRKIYKFNDTLDRNILLPVARGYKKRVPQPIRTGVSNFIYNLAEPWDAVNLLLQGEPKWSAQSVGRFTVNTLTSLGFGDYASKKGLINRDVDFGQTLGKWGVHSGPYVMLPFLGPSTFRDAFGRVVDRFGRVQYYIDKNSFYWTSYGVLALDKRAQYIGVEDIVQGDQYTLIRDLYLQRRQFKVSGEQQSSVDNSFGDTDASFGDAPADLDATTPDNIGIPSKPDNGAF